MQARWGKRAPATWGAIRETLGKRSLASPGGGTPRPPAGMAFEEEKMPSSGPIVLWDAASFLSLAQDAKGNEARA